MELPPFRPVIVIEPVVDPVRPRERQCGLADPRGATDRDDHHGGVDQVVISDSQLDAGRVNDLRELCSRQGVALTRLLVGLEDLVVVAADTPPGRSPALDALLKQGNEAEDKFAKANKDSPPLIEGDLFTSNFEGATSFRLGACAQSGKAGKCAVSLTYDPGKTNNPKDKPITWTDTLYLVETPSGWKIDDIGYGATWDFGNKGRMTGTLKSVIADAGN